MNKLICMTFDGEWVKEGEFGTVEKAWEHASDLGSKWFFLPFPFVLTASGKSIADSPDGMRYFNGKRLSTVEKFFNRVSLLDYTEGMGVDEFCSVLWGIWHEENRPLTNNTKYAIIY